jgi:hypothetical protein
MTTNRCPCPTQHTVCVASYWEDGVYRRDFKCLKCQAVWDSSFNRVGYLST